MEWKQVVKVLMVQTCDQGFDGGGDFSVICNETSGVEVLRRTIHPNAIGVTVQTAALVRRSKQIGSELVGCFKGEVFRYDVHGKSLAVLQRE